MRGDCLDLDLALQWQRACLIRVQAEAGCPCDAADVRERLLELAASTEV
jgi:hypothetical protein